MLANAGVCRCGWRHAGRRTGLIPSLLKVTTTSQEGSLAPAFYGGRRRKRPPPLAANAADGIPNGGICEGAAKRLCIHAKHKQAWLARRGPQAEAHGKHFLFVSLLARRRSRRRNCCRWLKGRNSRDSELDFLIRDNRKFLLIRLEGEQDATKTGFSPS